MNGSSNAKIGPGSSSEETSLMLSSRRKRPSKGRAHQFSTSLPYETPTAAGASPSVNKNSSRSKSHLKDNTDSQHRAASLSSSGQTLKRKPSLNVESESDFKDDTQDDYVLNDWFESDRSIPVEQFASTSTAASSSTFTFPSRFRPKRARPSTPPTDLSKSETESEDDESEKQPFARRSTPSNCLHQDQLQNKPCSRQRPFSPSGVRSDSLAKAASSSQDKGKGRIPTDGSLAFEEDDWCCSICQDILVGASVLGACGHEYCGKCIWEYIKAGNTQCAICRIEMTEPKAVVLFKLNELVEKWAEKTLCGEERKNWETRKDEWLAYKISLQDEKEAGLASKKTSRASQIHPLSGVGAYHDHSYHAFPPLGPALSRRMPSNNLGAHSASSLAPPPRVRHTSYLDPSFWNDRPSQRPPSFSGPLSTGVLHHSNAGTVPSRSYSSSSVWDIRPSAYTSSSGPQDSASAYTSAWPVTSSSRRRPQPSRVLQPGSMTAPARQSRSQASPEVVDLTAD